MEQFWSEFFVIAYGFNAGNQLCKSKLMLVYKGGYAEAVVLFRDVVVVEKLCGIKTQDIILFKES